MIIFNGEIWITIIYSDLYVFIIGCWLNLKYNIFAFFNFMYVKKSKKWKKKEINNK